MRQFEDHLGPNNNFLLAILTRPEEERAIILALPFDRRLPDAAGILRQHYKLLVQRNPEVKEWMVRAPMVAHLRPPNLRDVLVRAKLPPVDRRRGAGRRSQPGFRKCGKARCLSCVYSNNTSTLITWRWALLEETSSICWNGWTYKGM